jgi:histidinol-phosphatase (PHP family)
MRLTNFHTHCCYCDGSAPPGRYAAAAMEKGFVSLGFSSHAPLPFDNRWALRPEMVSEYIHAVQELKNACSGKLHIYLGLEIDYIPGITQSIRFLKDSYSLDYTIGAVHLVREPHSKKLWFIDGAPEGYDKGLRDIFDMDIRKAVGCYFNQLQDMMLQQKPDIIAHFDKIKMNNRGRYFSTSESWYLEMIDRTLDVMEQSGQIVEVNTRGIYTKRCDELYPSVKILEELCIRNIPVIVSSDAHKPEELDMEMLETMQVLRSIGFKHIMGFEGGKWRAFPLIP